MTLTIHNLSDTTRERLGEAARRHGRSLEEEAVAILDDAAAEIDLVCEGLGTTIARRFKGCGLTQPIPEWRGHPVVPVEFPD